MIYKLPPTEILSNMSKKKDHTVWQLITSIGHGRPMNYPGVHMGMGGWDNPFA